MLIVATAPPLLLVISCGIPTATRHCSTPVLPRKPPGRMVMAAACGGTATAAAAAAAGPLPPAPARLVVAWEGRVPAAETCRLDEALQRLWPHRYPTVTSAKKAVRRREVLVDGAAAANASLSLQGGEVLQCIQRQGAVVQPRQPAASLPASAATSAGLPQLEVVYEDDHMACVVKPPGIPVDMPAGRAAAVAVAASAAQDSPSASSSDARQQLVSMYTLLAHSLQPTQQLGAMRRPRHAHRLDEPTGGLLLVGKTRAAQAALCAAFERRQVTKRYCALLWGRLEGQGLVTYPLDGRLCETEYAAVQHTEVDCAALGICQQQGDGKGLFPAASETEASSVAGSSGNAFSSSAGGSGSGSIQSRVWVTTVDLYPHTGRKHQLRRHMALLGHPLLGDPRYSLGYAKQRLASGQAMDPHEHVRLPIGAAAAAAAGTIIGTAEAAPVVAAVPSDLSWLPEQPCSLLSAAIGAATEQLGLQLCLWAVELQLESHPATGAPLHFLLPEPPGYAATRAALSGSAEV